MLNLLFSLALAQESFLDFDVNAHCGCIGNKCKRALTVYPKDQTLDSTRVFNLMGSSGSNKGGSTRGLDSGASTDIEGVSSSSQGKSTFGSNIGTNPSQGNSRSKNNQCMVLARNLKPWRVSSNRQVEPQINFYHQRNRNWVMDLNSQGPLTLSRRVDTTPGEQYNINFWAQANPSCWHSTESVRGLIKVSNFKLQTFIADEDWKLVSYPFNATDDLSLVRIKSLVRGNCGILIHNITMKLVPKPIDCQVSDWSAWSSCSAPCGDGTQSRSRSIVKEAAFGGKACPALTESQPCKIKSCDTLGTNECIPANRELISQNGKCRFVLQSDTNLVLYHGNSPIWSSGKFGRTDWSWTPDKLRLCMQGDGNLVAYKEGFAFWSTRSNRNAKHNHAPYNLVMQGDCNAVIYGSAGTLWATRTARWTK